MLSPLRKFSSSIYAKIFLGIVIIPFVFWGMGSSFTSGNKNVVVVIDKEKHSTQDFVNFVKNFTSQNQKVTTNEIDEFLKFFISDKLLDKEIENLGIKLSNKSLSELIKNQKDFKRNNTFSRTEYEKFLLKNNMSAVGFEAYLAKQEKKKQLLEFIGGGVVPTKFIVNTSYNKIYQKRNIQVINLNDLFKKKLNFTDTEINTYYKNNKNDFKEIYKSVKILELNPKNLIDSNDFDELFFKRIDEIDNIIIEGENIDSILQKFNLGKAEIFSVNESGQDKNSELIKNIPSNLVNLIFSINEDEPTSLLELDNKYYIVELINTENIEKDIKNEKFRKKILSRLKDKTKRKLISEIVSRINQNNFKKDDFDKLSKEINSPIKKIKLINRNDDKILKKEVVDQIYNFAEKNLIVVHSIGLKENYMIYIDKVENVSIEKKSNDYDEYLEISKKDLSDALLNSYDQLIRNKYEIDINFKALDSVKSYLN